MLNNPFLRLDDRGLSENNVASMPRRKEKASDSSAVESRVYAYRYIYTNAHMCL